MFRNGCRQVCSNEILNKQEFIIFGSHVQLKKLDPYLPVRIFGNFMHPAVVVKNLGVWFDANFSFADHIRNICKTCFIQICDLRRVRKHLTDEAAILAANALVTSHLDYCNSVFRSSSSLNMRKLQCIQNTLARIVTNCNKYTQASPILKRLHWLPVEFRCIFKTATLVTSFFTMVIPVTLVLFCLLIVEDIVQDITIQIKGSWRFLNSVHLYINQKITLATALLLMLPQFGIICLMRSVLPQLAPVSGKG